MRKLTRMLTAILLCLCLLPAGFGAYAQSAAEGETRLIRVIELTGACIVERAGETLPAAADMALLSGDVIETPEGGSARILLDEDKFLFLDGATRVGITAEGNAADSCTMIWLEKGSMYTDVRQKLSEASVFEIFSANSAMSIRGTKTLTQVLEDAVTGAVQTSNAVLEGQVKIKAIKVKADGTVVSVERDLGAGEGNSFKSNKEELVSQEEMLSIADSGAFDSGVKVEIVGEEEEEIEFGQMRFESSFLETIKAILISDIEDEAGEEGLTQEQIDSINATLNEVMESLEKIAQNSHIWEALDQPQDDTLIWDDLQYQDDTLIWDDLQSQVDPPIWDDPQYQVDTLDLDDTQVENPPILDDPLILIDDPQEGDPEEGDPEEGDPEEGDPEEGDLDEGDLEEGDPEEGDPEEGDPEEGDQQVGDPQDEDPQEGDPQEDKQNQAQNEHKHSYPDVQYTWSEALDECIASGTCLCDWEAAISGKISTSTVEPTCSTEGSITYTAVFGENWVETQTKTVPVAMKAHTPEVIPAVPSTCTEKGLTEGSQCKECGTILVAQQLTELIDHTPEVIPAVPSTCTEKGLTEGSRCKECGTILIAQQETDMIAHTPGEAKKENEVAATSCGEGGGGSYDSVVRCTECGAILASEHVVTDPLPHAWKEPEWAWDEKFTAAEAKFVCNRDDTHTVTLRDDNPAKEKTPATTEATGKIVYTATAELDGKTYTDSKETELPKLLQPELDTDYPNSGPIRLECLYVKDGPLLENNTVGGLIDSSFGWNTLRYNGQNIATTVSYSANTDLGATPTDGQTFSLTVTFTPRDEADVYAGITNTYSVTVFIVAPN